MEDTDTIQLGNYVIIQRQKYIKLQKFASLDTTTALGKDQIALKNINKCPYFTTFKMIYKSNDRKGKKFANLEPCSSITDLKDILQTKESGSDNRNILDDGQSQGLTADDIEKLRDSCTSSTEIVEHLIENSKTFNSKTGYAQEKYLKKKEKKYFEYIQIKRPTIRMIAEIFYRQDPEKILGMRMDTLSQIISYSGVCSTGNYLVYESGTNGLVPAAFLNSIGANTESQVVHLHPGNVPQKQALIAMNFEEEQLNRCISVNLYSVLRHYYQASESIAPELNEDTRKRKHDDQNDDEQNSPQIKRICIESEKNGDNDNKQNESVIPKWRIENERASKLFHEKFDSLVIIAKEHPSTILKALLPFIKPSRPVVIFSSSREVLAESYVDLKTTGEVTGLRLISNWLRMYQILPNRTHPDVNMGGNSGFLLYGYRVE